MPDQIVNSGSQDVDGTGIHTRRAAPYRVAARTNSGLREYQEDAYGWMQMKQSESDFRLACVLADGMGGAPGGGVASRLAVSTILRNLTPYLLRTSGEQWEDIAFCRSVMESTLAYTAAVFSDVAKGEPRLEEMATTVAVTIHTGSRVIVYHSGDSRIYACGQQFKLLTKDHSAAWEFVESGDVSPSDLRHIPTRSMLTRFLRSDTSGFDMISHPDADGMAFLLATDGVWELFDVDELDELSRALRKPHVAPDSVADNLQAELLRRGPDDNATFMLVARTPSTRGLAGRYPHIENFPAFTKAYKEEDRHGD